jgi:hypothetical protein
MVNSTWSFLEEKHKYSDRVDDFSLLAVNSSLAYTVNPTFPNSKACPSDFGSVNEKRDSVITPHSSSC